MDKWNTLSISAGQDLGQVGIRRGIFKDDILSPLLFITCLIPLTLTLRKINAGYSLGKDLLITYLRKNGLISTYTNYVSG